MSDSISILHDPPRATHPIVIGLTRPTTMMGVPLVWFAVTGGIPAAGFVIFEEIFAWALMPVLHGIGYALTVYDNRFIDILALRVQKIRINASRLVWGGNTYAP
jgi:type IV secretion system protein VirB3